MITKNFKILVATFLCASGSGKPATIPITTTGNFTYYLSGDFYRVFPESVGQSLTLSASGTGISVGTDNTPATEDDYNLHSTITSGLSGTTSSSLGIDSNGNPQIKFVLTITNTGSSPVTINEIGYKQNVQGNMTPGSTSSYTQSILLDRTVLGSPVIIPAGEYAIIDYTLKGLVTA